jgi:hypothetical protein
MDHNLAIQHLLLDEDEAEHQFDDERARFLAAVSYPILRTLFRIPIVTILSICACYTSVGSALLPPSIILLDIQPSEHLQPVCTPDP